VRGGVPGGPNLKLPVVASTPRLSPLIPVVEGVASSSSSAVSASAQDAAKSGILGRFFKGR
jgi:hypothetical protein